MFAIGEKGGMLEIVAMFIRAEIHAHLFAAVADVEAAPRAARAGR